MVSGEISIFMGKMRPDSLRDHITKIRRRLSASNAIEIMKQLNEIPRSGRDLVFDNVRFRVEQANRRCIELVHVEVLAESSVNSGESEKRD